ncbi:MAG: Hsp20/alpha crystallin family protein [Syntrophobacteraceae bacterium]|jgi:HSP20 family protein
MTRKKETSGKLGGGVEGLFRGLAELVEKLGDLAEKGEELSRSGEIPLRGQDKDLKGVFGFSVRVGLGDKGVKVEPFGNVTRDKTTGKTVVDEIREPLVDVFEEEDHVLVIAEMPGIEAEDVKFELKDDILSLSAQRGDKKYRKEVLLPGGRFHPDKVSVSCKHGIVEMKCLKS